MSLPTLVSFTKVDSSIGMPRWRLTFSEPVTGVRLQDFSLSGSGSYFTGAAITALTAEGDGGSWLLSVLPGAGEGRFTPSFTGTAVRDLDGNLMAARIVQTRSFDVAANVPLVALDADRDGRLDIVTGDSLRLGRGDGSFSSPASLAGGVAGVPLAIDGDGDGRLDLVVAGATGAFLRGQGSGFATGVTLDLGGQARALLAADVNGDGRADVVVAPTTGGTVRVALQKPTGGFFGAVDTGIAPSATAQQNVAVGDINGDGRADLAVFDGDAVKLWLGQANGSFAAGNVYAIGLNSSGLALADFNGDGRLDLLTQGLNISVRPGNGMGGFGERLESQTRIPDAFQPTVSPYPSYTIPRELPVQVIRDVTGDGIADLIGISHLQQFFFGTYYTDEAFITPGRGDGTFAAPISQGGSSTGLGEFRAYADFNNDGRDDFFTARLPNQGFTPTTLKWALSMPEVATASGDEAAFFTAPRLLGVAASTPDAQLGRNQTVNFTLQFDREVRLYNDSFLRLSNGGVATAYYTYGSNPSEAVFRYIAREGEVSQDVGIRALVGTIEANGLEPDLSSLGPVPGQLQVVARTPLYFANSDGRLAAWTLDGLSVFDKLLLSNSGGAGAQAVIHTHEGDAVFYRAGYTQGVSPLGGLATGYGALTALGAAGDKWSFVGEGGSGGLSGRVFWHSNLGEVVFWNTIGGSSSPRAWLGQATTDWRVAAIADTTGDGAADVLFQNQDGRVALWQVVGTAVTRREVIDIVTPDWSLVAAGDLNGDGKADLLYRNQGDNRLVVRFLDGFAGIGDNQVIGTATTDWSIADLRDLNGDAREDILWRNTSGDFAVWTMNGTQILAQQLLDKVSPDWVLLT